MRHPNNGVKSNKEYPTLGPGFPKDSISDAEIFKSARTGLTENVKCLLSLGKASANDNTIFGTTLLHSASKSGSVDLVCLLIREGADVNGQDEDGESPLHGAMAKSDNYDMARTFIENGADLSSKAVDDKTPFQNIFNNTIRHVLTRDNWLEIMVPDSEAPSITHFLAWSSRSTPEISNGVIDIRMPICSPPTIWEELAYILLHPEATGGCCLTFQDMSHRKT